MIGRLVLGSALAMSMAVGAIAQEAPSAVPPGFSASSPSISFSSPSIGFVSPRIEFTSPAMTEEELALGPKTAPPPPPAVKGLDVQEVEGGVRYTLSADILFDFDKAILRPKATQALEAMSKDVRERFDKARFLVDGYTDSKGSDGYNLKLSFRRADAVKDFLTKKESFEAALIDTEGRGEGNPVAPNETPEGKDDPDGRQKNRRVEILVRPAE
ncbi:OmpA family protein [Rhizobium sp. CC-YZS058]|uniref:OmpA family protein n=1 Tax=Rhizobium sp. CC-YZS058 TaxID=3042153 RepID=UPI002B058730|nr:OmpA family protein [Rhizobium sp. CC-YZS058]MEA3533245.1 OmpA family protein [Rhizobium sp. CC-YZS058]